jgi:Flp pilus assembly protein TadG
MITPGGGRIRERGSGLIEFAIVGLLLCLLLLVFVEFGRIILVYNSVNHSARAGTRYAIVHGANRAGGSGVDGQSGPGNTVQVENVVRNFASTAPLDPSRLIVAVTYPAISSACGTADNGGSNVIGSIVQVAVTYPYDPFLGYFPLSFNLRGCSQGRIAF